MLSPSNLSALAGFLSLAAVAVDAKPVGLYAVEAPPHYSNGAAADAQNVTTMTTSSSSYHHYNTTGSSKQYAYSNGTTDGIHWGNLRCPNNMSGQSNQTVTVLPTPTYGTKDRAWMVCSETLIRAAPRAVYDALLDFGRYRDWNSYVTDVEAVRPASRVYEGMALTFTFHGLGGEGVVTTGPEVLTVMRGVEVTTPGNRTTNGPDSDSASASTTKKTGTDNGYLMNAWRSDLSVADELIRSEHPNVVTDAGEGYTRLVSWETYYDGKSTETFKLLRGQMQALQERQGADLKAYLEEKKF
ncbi:uncharacterized protein PG986_015146 [Apiospora aurea]|uniref:Uncharacterized protein n=1 Tax=Apiospora aurea TaxID=335848 RepID=A0ABR1PRQ5_9PEZI